MIKNTSQGYWTAIGRSAGEVIQTIQTISNNNCNYIYYKCKIKIKNYNRNKSEFLSVFV